MTRAAQKYPGVQAGSYAERAIDMVRAKGKVSGPDLAMSTSGSTYSMSWTRRPIDLGYLKKAKSGNTNVFTLGDKLRIPALSEMVDMPSAFAEEEIHKPNEEAIPANIVPPRTAPEFRPLDLKKITPHVREDALFWRGVQSLHTRKP
jgi:hypothetical protein